MIKIREETEEDAPAIRRVHELAFGQPTEANIVDKLRTTTCPKMLSLVAVQDDEVIGHILFSPVILNSDQGEVQGMGLAPMAVLPAYQRKGAGTGLVEEGLKRLRQAGCPFVIVLGHPDYYPRFGFEKASRYTISSQWNGVPGEAFMIRVFNEEVMPSGGGVVRYRDEFNEAG